MLKAIIRTNCQFIFNSWICSRGYRVGRLVGWLVEWCKLSLYANEPRDEEAVYFERWLRWSTILVTFWFCHVTCSAMRMSCQKNFVKLYYAFENDKLFKNRNIKIYHTKMSKTIISVFSNDIFYLFLFWFELFSSCRASFWHWYITNINFATWRYIHKFLPLKSLISENKYDFSLHLVSLDHWS